VRTLFEHSYTRATNRIDAERRAEKRKEAAQAAATALATALDQDAGKRDEGKGGEEMALIKPGAPAADMPTELALAPGDTVQIAPGDTVQIQPSAITSGSLPERFSLCEAAVVDASDMPTFLQV
jgi:hypothetical protein